MDQIPATAAPTTTTAVPNMISGEQQQPMVIRPQVFETHQIHEILAHYHEHGFVVLKALTEEFCKKAVKEQVEHVLLKQPWTDEYKLKVYRDNDLKKGSILDLQSDTDAYIRTLTSPNIPNAILKKYKEAWPLHRVFGACCDDAVFHLPCVWEVRQDIMLYAVAKALLLNPEEEIWVDINRSIHKLPTEGETEFLHWDVDKFGEYIPDRGIQGKAMYTDGQFVCVPGTHTAAFHEHFKHCYTEHYAELAARKQGASKTGLDSAKPDPLQLVQGKKTFLLPAGCVLFWSNNLLHGQEPTPRNANIEFGMYLGYMRSRSRPAYAAEARKKQQHVNRRLNGKGYLNLRPLNEIEDRLCSYTNGVAPMLWPSLDWVWFYPKRYENFPNLFANVFKKMTPEALAKYRCRQVTQNGKELDALLPWENTGYVPPPLSDLGKRLLGMPHAVPDFLSAVAAASVPAATAALQGSTAGAASPGPSIGASAAGAAAETTASASQVSKTLKTANNMNRWMMQMKMGLMIQ